MADLGVDLVGEVERSGAGRKVDDVAPRGEGVDPLRFDLPAQRGERGSGPAGLFAGLQELPQPCDAGVRPRLRTPRALLVAPVRRDPQLGLGVHLAGADLHLQGPAARPDHRGVQRPVAVRLGVGDVVVELAGDMRPQPVHGAERRIALGLGVHEHAQRPQVEQLLDAGLLDAERLALHLAPDAVDVLGAAGHLGIDPLAPEPGADPAHGLLDVAFTVDAPFVELPGDGLVRHRIRFAEREVFDLPFVLPDAEAARERGVDLQALAGEALAFGAGTLARGA